MHENTIKGIHLNLDKSFLSIDVQDNTQLTLYKFLEKKFADFHLLHLFIQ